MNLYDLLVAKKLSGGGGGGGGSSNVVKGTFKGTENGVLDVAVPYTGTGYPLSILIYPKDGVDCSGTAFYDVVCQNTIALWTASKSLPNEPTTYPDRSTTAADKTDYVNCRKSSSAHTFNQGSARNIETFRKNNPTASSSDAVKMWSATELKVLISDGGYGFYPNIEFEYVISYSS